MSIQNIEEKGQRERPSMTDVFGFQVPTTNYYMHRIVPPLGFNP